MIRKNGVFQKISKAKLIEEIKRYESKSEIKSSTQDDAESPTEKSAETTLIEAGSEYD